MSVLRGDTPEPSGQRVIEAFMAAASPTTSPRLPHKEVRLMSCRVGRRRVCMTDIQRKTMCIYHGHCVDGFSAARLVRKALGADIGFDAAKHG